MSFTALTRVQFELSGGWRQNGLVMVGYVMLVMLTAGAAYHVAGPQAAREVDSMFMVFISVIQGVWLLLVAPAAVRRAVLRDFQAGMIESHRLTPLSGTSLVLGYVTGATAQAGLLYALGLVVGGYFAISVGQRLGIPLVTAGTWYGAQFCLLPLALLIVAVTLLTALATRGKTHVLPILTVLSVVGGWFLVWLIPGLALLMGALSAGLIVRVLGGSTPFATKPEVLVWAVVLQTAFGLTLLAAARRKVRAPEKPVFTLPLALLLLGLSGMTLAIGWRCFADFQWMFASYGGAKWQWLGSVTAFLLVALFALATAASERRRSTKAATLDLIPLLVAAGSLALALGMFSPPQTIGEVARSYVLPLGAVLVASCWTDYQCLRWARTGLRSPFIVILVEWALLKLMPLVLQVVVSAAREVRQVEAREDPWLAGFSPIGTLLLLHEGSRGSDLLPGLAWQLAFAAAATWLSGTRRATQRLSRAAAGG